MSVKRNRRDSVMFFLIIFSFLSIFSVLVIGLSLPQAGKILRKGRHISNTSAHHYTSVCTVCVFVCVFMNYDGYLFNF